MPLQYWNRYTDFLINGQQTVVPYIDLPSKSSDKNSIKSKNSFKSKNSCLSNNSVKPRSQSKIMRFMKKSVPCLYKILNRN